MVYFDTSYLARLYLQDTGYEAVRVLAAQRPVATSRHGRTEITAALHRAFREGRFDESVRTQVMLQADQDFDSGFLRIFELTETVYRRAEKIYSTAPPSAFLRAADALHLACAAEYGFNEIHSHDRHLLLAAPLFGLRGVNVI